MAQKRTSSSSRRLFVLMVTAGILVAGCVGAGERARLEDGGEVIERTSEYERFESLEEMAVASDLVVLGHVQRWAPGRTLSGGETRSEVVTVQIIIDQVLAGDARPGDVVSFPWEAHELRPDGEPGRTILVEGIRPPAPGQELVVFLRELPPDQERDAVVRPTHYVATFDGVFTVTENGVVRSELQDFSEGEGLPRLGIRLTGLRIEELSRQVAQAAGS